MPVTSTLGIMSQPPPAAPKSLRAPGRCIAGRENPATPTHSKTHYLNPQNMQKNSLKPIIIAIQAIILHTFGIQV